MAEKRGVVRAWALARDGEIILDSYAISKRRQVIVTEKRGYPNFWKHYRIVPVEIREIKPKKRKTNG